jgi:hypothetical protein
MDQRRLSKRARTLLEGRIVFNNRFSLIQCTIRDISDTGAQIYFAHPVAIPQEFELEIPKRGLSVRARVMWSREKSHGVEFIEDPYENLLEEAPDAQREPNVPGNGSSADLLPNEAGVAIQDIVDAARRRIAQIAGVPAETVRLKLEIDF